MLNITRSRRSVRSHVKDAQCRLRVKLANLANIDTSNPAQMAAEAWKAYRETVSDYMANPERGAINVQSIGAIFVGIVLLTMVITFLWQTGLPEIVTATNNTTAMEAAGATASQISWMTFAGGAIVILLIVGAIMFALRSTNLFGGSGGGRPRWRRKR